MHPPSESRRTQPLAVARRHGIEGARAFGSMARGDAGGVDLFVILLPSVGGPTRKCRLPIRRTAPLP